MADGRVVGANENMLNDSMDKILISNISRDIDILLDDREKEESDESFIDRKLSEIHLKQVKSELLCELQDFVKAEIIKVHDSHYLKNDSFYSLNINEKNGENKSLFKYLNERITFLEEEIRFKNQLINNIMATTKSIKHNTTNLPQVAEDFNSNVNVDSKYEQLNFCLPKKPISIKKVSTKNVTDNHFIHSNKYASLPIEVINDKNDNRPIETKNQTHINDDRLMKRKRNRNNKSKNKVKSIHIIGDSIIKEIKGWKLSDNNNSVTVKTFPGASTNCMKSYVKPTIEKKPDVVILHCGTNDLRSNLNPDELSMRIVNLALTIKKENNSVLVSGITARNDKLSDKVGLINGLIDEMSDKVNVIKMTF